MKNKMVLALSFLVVGSFSVSALAKPNVLCDQKREKVEKSVCSKSSSEEKKKECITFYKNADCPTVALHEVYDQEL